MLDDYYTVHKYDSAGNAWLGIVPNSISTKRSLKQGIIPEFNEIAADLKRGNIKDKRKNIIIISSVHGSVSILLILLYALYIYGKLDHRFKLYANILVTIIYFAGCAFFQYYVIQVLLEYFLYWSR